MVCDDYYRKAVVTKVIDGDTFDAQVDLGFFVTITVRFRITGINAPEVKGEEKQQGLAAKAFLKELIEEKEILIHSTKRDGFRRYLAEAYFFINDAQINIATYMVNKGHAKVQHYTKKS